MWFLQGTEESGGCSGVPLSGSDAEPSSQSERSGLCETATGFAMAGMHASATAAGFLGGSYSKGPGRGVAWQHDETRDLIGIWGKEEVQRTLKSSYRNMDVFEKVAAEMSKRGHSRTAIECRTKAKSLKRDFKRVVQHNKISGNRPKTLPFYKELDIIVGNNRNINPPEQSRAVVCVAGNTRGPAASNPPPVSHPKLETINEMDIRASSPSQLASGKQVKSLFLGGSCASPCVCSAIPAV
ncbi:myb/SANT-like DNA-binding domain-containing protein 2 [Sphaerodactylus townsendi]|uniref:myb/SANT-like DNA-binding domain-containing protein 2 n=1 Tax=Sphaerodactylus townsendi TaxID=933632 RepID=UPI0020263CB4|nr:myb/SANT-like DNA-binding domain-containing protein 2 [Sphaerodactylus townsendi]